MVLRRFAGAFAVLVVVACGSSGATSGGGAPDGGGGDGGGGDDGGAADGQSADGPVDAPPPVACGSLPLLTLKVATLAGCDSPGAIDGARPVVRFSNPTNALIGPNGVTYVSDFDGNRLRAVDPDGTTRTIVKNGFQRPFGMALAPNGTLYVQTDTNDAGMHSNTTGTVWKVDVATGATTVIARNLGRPRGLAVLADGRIAMADYIHHVLSFLDPASGAVTPLAGTADAPGYTNATGAAARFAQPYDVVVLPDGDLAVSDLDNHRIRRVTLAGVVTDFAGSGVPGSDDGPVASATFDAPKGLAVSGTAVFVTDVKRWVVRKIDGGQVVTFAGDGTAGWNDADDPRAAKFYGLEGLDADATHVVVADGNNGDDSLHHRVRILHLN